MVGEQLVLAIRLENGQTITDALRQQIAERNRLLPDFKRVNGFIFWDQDFPRTASMKIKRNVLAEQIRERVDRSAMQPL